MSSTTSTITTNEPLASAPNKSSQASLPSKVLGFLHTLYLFTASDFKTVVYPKTIVGVLNGLSGLFSVSTTATPPTAEVLSRVPLVFLWIWINLFPFNINNQRQPAAIVEDKANKSWRPLPSNQLTPKTAFRIMLVGYGVAFSVSYYLGALTPSLALLGLGIAYNDFHAADRSCISRNLNNAGLYLGFITGASMVGIGGDALNSKALQWFALLYVTVFTTGHMQDIPDRIGDKARGRNTVPLVIGDSAGRWTVALGTMFWSVVLPAFWDARWWAYLGPVGLGLWVVGRVMTLKSVEEDDVTFVVWNAWISVVYTLPFLRSLG
ncbi:MAG: hypothetical protein Q9225_001084 [Loekoesia sp. 1 TL-2023]